MTSSSLTDVWRLDGGFGHVGAGSVADGEVCATPSAVGQAIQTCPVRFLARAVFAAPTGVTSAANGRHSAIQLTRGGGTIVQRY